ncbi:MAG: aldehyde ferredoxin oxidoreductase family protein [Desulfocucumaceae bacterium]
MPFGWRGKLLRVNLDNEIISEEIIDHHFLKTWIGGRGLGAALLARESPPSPTGGEEKLIFSAGPLTGTGAPGSGRFSLTARSPLTGTIFDSSAGGMWGIMLKRCGYDAIIIEGRCSRPSYLAVIDGKCSLHNAGELWGLEIPAACSAVKKAHGDSVSVAAIGPAGENGILLASVITDDGRSLGRGGLGSIMGGKNLKAVVLSGSQKISIADHSRYDYFLYEANKWIKANPITSKGLPEFGTPVLVNLFNELGALPAYNFQKSYFEGAYRVSGEAIAERAEVKRAGCRGCPVRCTRVVRGRSGMVHGPEYETVWSMGPQCGIDDLDTIIEANSLCNRLGMDTISTGSTIGCAMEMAAAGYLESPLRFGDREGLLEMINKMAYRKEEGQLLADGSLRLASGLGHPEYAMQVKGLEIPAYDPRGLQGMGLGFATSNRGACHLRAYMVGTEVLGIPKRVDRFSTGGKAGLTIFNQNINAAVDSLSICRFITLAVSEEYFARLLSAVTGEHYQPLDLHLAGERIWNLERIYNLGCGFGSADDRLPERLTGEPVKEGPSRGQTVRLGEMLGDYYRFRGWDSDGVPTKRKIAQLGLEEYTC